MGQRGIVGVLWVIAAGVIVLVVALVVIPRVQSFGDNRTDREKAQADAADFCASQVGENSGVQYEDCVGRFLERRGYSD